MPTNHKKNICPKNSKKYCIEALRCRDGEPISNSKFCTEQEIERVIAIPYQPRYVTKRERIEISRKSEY